MIKNHGSDAEQQPGDDRRVLAREKLDDDEAGDGAAADDDRGVAAEPDAADRHHEVDARIARAVGLDGGEEERRDADQREPDEARAGNHSSRRTDSTRPVDNSAIATITSGPSACRPGWGR